MKKIFVYLLLALPAMCFLNACGSDNDEEEGVTVIDDDGKDESTTISLTSTNLTEDGYFDGMLYYKVVSSSPLDPLEVFVSKAERNVVKVEIPKTINIDGKNYKCTSIGSEAFSGCKSLTSITIPNSVTSIGYEAFSGTGWYNNQSDGILYLDNWLIGYKGDEPSGELIIAEGTRGIADYAFVDCSGLTSVTISNSVASIGKLAFAGCHRLTSITIPNSVTSIGEGAFELCSGLTAIVVEEGNTKYDSRNNCNAVIETSSNTLIAGCKNTVIPNNVTSIGNCAFWGCYGLTSVTIPNSVTSIGWGAFYGCGLTSVTVPNSVTFIGDYAFQDCI